MIKIEHQLLINGQEYSTYNEFQLYKLISETEQEIDFLESIENKPASIPQRIKEAKEAIKALVLLMDNRC